MTRISDPIERSVYIHEGVHNHLKTELNCAGPYLLCEE
jgi:hypothetical protein